MTFLRLQPQDCSPLGREVLRHMQVHQVSMNALAKQVHLSQPSLRVLCLGKTTPTRETLCQLAHVLQRHPTQLYLLSYETADSQAVDVLLQALEATLQRLKAQQAARPDTQTGET